MSQSFEQRLTAVEARVDEEATLRARMDSDQSDLGAVLRVTKRLVQVLGTTQNEQTRMLQDHARKLDEHSKKLDEHSNEFVKVNAKLDLLIDVVGRRRKRPWRRPDPRSTPYP